jgi:uncharacterized protein
MFNRIVASPVLVRIIPFVIFAALTLLQGRLGTASQYWVYTTKTVLGAWMIWVVWPHIREMRWRVSWEAVMVGVLVFAAWVGLDGHYPLLAAREGAFNPIGAYGSGSAAAFFFLGVRILGSSLVVPPLEEVFYRSFLYRYLVKSDFLQVPLSYFNRSAFLIAGSASESVITNGFRGFCVRLPSNAW